MKLNTKIVITFAMLIIIPLVLVFGSYFILRFGFGFSIYEHVEVDGQKYILVTQEGLISGGTQEDSLGTCGRSLGQA